MQIYVVYEARMWPYTNKIEICEFFNSKQDSDLFRGKRDNHKYLESYCFPDLFSPPYFNSDFTKGVDGEIIIEDTRLIEYFVELNNFYKQKYFNDSMETRFINRILLDSIEEVEARLRKLEPTKLTEAEG